DKTEDIVENNEEKLSDDKSVKADNTENYKSKDDMKGEDKMQKVMSINGMMCAHCEARVKKSLEAIDGVTEAVASHEKKEAVVTLSKEVDNEILKKAVEDEDYEVVDIK
ncbi:MAG: heavy-metal-associated domain-containing protein, partial [Lachnospiraceae bacterium]|nr:heavy-metal-associated domain-containing protein [Lachnospiraceae bacterium]